MIPGARQVGKFRQFLVDRVYSIGDLLAPVEFKGRLFHVGHSFAAHHSVIFLRVTLDDIFQDFNTVS